MILPMIASIFLIIAIVCFLNLTPQQISQDINSVISKKPNLRDRARALRAGKNKKGLGAKLEYLQSALASCGKEGKFALVCSSALVLFAIGAVVSILLMIFKIKKSTDYMAFGPFIVIATVITMFLPYTVLFPWYMNLLSLI